MKTVNKNTLLDVYSKHIPTKPFLAIIGTSHTCGDCNDGTVRKPYGKLLAEQLGLDFLNLGYSGAFNDDLLEITLTALESGLLKNCKLLLIEGRLGTTIKQISRVPVIPTTSEIFKKPNFDSSDIVDTQHFKGKAVTNPKTSDLYYFIGDAELSITKLFDLLKIRAEDNINASPHAITKLLEYIRSKIYYESHTPMDIYHDMVKLHAMCNLSKSVGIETYWFNVNGFPVNASFIDSLYSNCIIYKDKTDFDYDNYIVNGASRINLQSLIINKYGLDQFNRNLCKCSHGNQVMHQWMTEILLEKLNAARNN